MRIWVDPPEGWRYGFPKIWDNDTKTDFQAWLVENGYPEKLAKKKLFVRFWEAVEVDKP
jgi:hypothetical protein